MRNPYEVLGVPDGAPIDQVKAAYKILARKYQNDNSFEAQQKMEELNAAYDSIIMNSGSSYRNTDYSTGQDYSDITAKIRFGRLDDAQILLDGIPEQSRDAQWYYLKGTVMQKRGWLEEAANHFATASRMDPSNNTYKMAYNRVINASSGGYRTERRRTRSGRDNDCCYCDCCCDLLCADACCECMGGDLISCC
ncbi:MAG: J domain-containing protein [Clostridia bacterium]|nr:J domain-containing protein [Clostridia bacterium]